MSSIQIGQTEIKFPVRFDEGYGVIFDADNVKILDVDAAYPDKKWTPRRATELGRLIAAALNRGEEEKKNDRLKSALKYMLHIFDRALPEDSIGKRACNEAREALKDE